MHHSSLHFDRNTIVIYTAHHGEMDGDRFATLVHHPDSRGPEAVCSEYNLRFNTDCYMIRQRRNYCRTMMCTARSNPSSRVP